jgi:excisionase family DNA binding protein
LSLLVAVEVEDGWLTVGEASGLLGVPVWRVSEMVRWGGLLARRDGGGDWLIERAELAAWSLSSPAPRRVRVRADRYVSRDHRPHVDLLEAVGLADAELAFAVGVAARRVARWHEHGVPNLYVARLRALIGSGRAGPSS